MNTNTLKLAVQKNGRLTEETLAFLRAAGLEFESYNRKLRTTCRNFPLEILYVRDDDIPMFVSTGAADLGILGQNVLNEERPNVKKLLNLRYGFCTLTLSVPKESPVRTINDLAGKIIATTYPRSAKQYFDSCGVPITTVTLKGSVEIAPALGLADAIVDLASTGSTLTLNDLRALSTIYRSEAVLIANGQSVRCTATLQSLGQLITRFKSVLSAENNRYVVMNAPSASVPKLRKLIPTVTSSDTQQNGYVRTQGVVNRDAFWSILNRLNALGITDICLLPVENIIAKQP